jgi:Domain of unknown function (DUF4352)
VARRLLLFGLLTLIVVAAVGWSLSQNRNGSTSSSSASVPSLPASSSHEASSGNASHPSPTRRETADTVTWHIRSVYTTHRIENEYLPSTASGIYLIMDVVVTNDTNDTLPLDSDHVHLRLDKTDYSLDATALSALELAGHKALSGTVRPAETATGWVVFDVAPRLNTSTPHLCLKPPEGDDVSGSTGCSA